MKRIGWWMGAIGSLACVPTEEVSHPVRSQKGNDTADSQLGSDPETDPENGSQPDVFDTAGSDSTEEDSAEVISVDLPVQLECGETYPASIEMLNTGTATWTRADGYKLGAVEDADFLYGPDTRVWLPEGVSVPPGERYVFDFELTAPEVEDAYLTDWQMVHESVRWFGEQTSEIVEVMCGSQTTCDPLTDQSLTTGFSEKDIQGGTFSSAGWQTTDSEDQLRLALQSGISSTGSLEIQVTNFDPTTQYSGTKHQIINMYTSDDGSQNVFDSDEAWWNIRTGTNYGSGFKFLAAANGGDSREEVRIMESASWDPADTHTFSVHWDSNQIHIYLNEIELETLAFDGQVQPLQHIFIGKDNVYEGQVGPIYSNLCVTQNP